ncbi:MAG TPA: PH domain-containing protein [Candidatus Acidoferrum sp.]|nr:PH domain-containing protein [Candidatus Acidoferrum sp.]
MSYVEKHLIPGETVQYQTNLHWIVMLGHAGLAAFFLLAGIALLVFSFSTWHNAESHSTALIWLGLASLVVAGVFLGIGVVKRNATEMSLTNKRVIVKTGLATRRTIELLLSRIESVVVEESAMGRVLGYGTVIIRGTGGTPELFEKIAHPLEFREQVQSQISSGQKQS